MGIAIAATIYLVSSIVFDVATALVATAFLAAALVGTWFYLPYVTFRTNDAEI